jgi:hypothetical protein
LTIDILAQNPAVADADRWLMKFLQDTATVAEACRKVAEHLDSPAERNGKDPLIYYDDFTQLLVEIAEAGGIAPKLGNDDITGKPCGWLFDAAMALEPFLYSELHSPSITACGQRLRRSLNRIAPNPASK